MARQTFTVEKFEKKDPTRGGKKWCRAQLKPGGWASCFEDDAQRELLYKSALATATGETLLLSGDVKVTDEEKGYKNVEDVKLATAEEEAAAPAPGFTGKAKDVSIVRQTAWKVTAPIMAALVNHGLGVSRDKESDTVNVDIGAILQEADFIAHHIEQDILTEEELPPESAEDQPAPDDDIPF